MNKMYVKIKADIKDAMRNKDNIKRDVLKMVVDKAKTIMKERNPTDSSDVIPDDVILQAINKEIKQLNQTKDALSGRENSQYFHETTLKMEILNEYLPKQMTREEVEKAVAEILSKGGYNNFGMMMKSVMTELRGKADNKLIKEVVENFNKVIDGFNKIPN
jgi:uncharacterized protein YqeY